LVLGACSNGAGAGAGEAPGRIGASAGTGVGASTGAGDGSWRGAAHVAGRWRSGIRAVESPLAADDSAVFHALTAAGDFELVSLDPGSGRPRWTAPASPSRGAPGVGLSTMTLDGGRVVVWMEPGQPVSAGAVTAGGVSVVAAEARSGRRLWSYGDGRLELPSAPEVCGDGDICVPAGNGSGPIILDGRTGTPRNSAAQPANLAGPGQLRRPFHPLDPATPTTPSIVPVSIVPVSTVAVDTEPSPGYSRSIGAGLYDNGRDLVAYTEAGAERWRRPYATLFRGLDVSPDYGWKVGLSDDLYVVSLGYVPPPEQLAASRSGAPLTLDAARLWATAAFDAQTGETLWVSPTATTYCGGLNTDMRNPVRCTYTGTVRYGAQDSSAEGVQVTVEGFGAESGRTTWRWVAGAVPGLVFSTAAGSPDILRVDDTRYAVRTPQRTVLLDVANGPLNEPPPVAGWCFTGALAKPGFTVDGNGGDARYKDDRWYPCAEGGPVDVPSTTPRFAGALVGNMYAWRDADGQVRGGHVS
ncbi:PQQ-like beta-propeller repeat protein, partial [Frankia sp. AiPs1]|uniref:PQQ-binding-like beta-propeller repeat protein n=1 Tax=Frankia sp. AiPs1 TaxID=573493 RepID=UPI00204419D7